MTQTTTTSISLGGGTPDQLGSVASDLVGMHGARVIQQAAIVAVGTSAAVSGAFGYTATQAAAIVTAVNSIISVLQAKGLTA